MKAVVIGGTGLIGSKVVNILRQKGHEVIVGSPSTGINSITGEGLADAFVNADIVVDLANSPSFEDKAAMEFFETAGRNLTAAELNAGVKHHIALSVVGTNELQESGYFRAKQVQEELIRKSGIPFTIVHATQFMEFVPSIVAFSSNGVNIQAATAKIQPIAAEDVAALVAEIALETPANGIVEIGGPERFSLVSLLQNYLVKTGDARQVAAMEENIYFGAHISDLTLVPGDGARLGSTTFNTWFSKQSQKA